MSQAKGTAEDLKSGESVKATRYTPNAADLAVTATSPGWVVLTDAWYPGWQVTVDGHPAEIVPADYAYRAVKVDPGQHTISMRFSPTSWQTGRLISLVALVASLLALALLILWPLIRTRRGRANTPENEPDKVEAGTSSP